LQGNPLSKVLTTDAKGVYEDDFPLGVYAMTVENPGFEVFHRPPFRVTSPRRITLDITLRVRATCDPHFVGAAPTSDQFEDAVRRLCVREDFFPASSRDGVPFQVYVHYGSRKEIDGSFAYTGLTERPVFVAYNLFSLQADSVTYDVKNRTIQASGNVVAANESVTTARADSMTFKIENGQAVPVR